MDTRRPEIWDFYEYVVIRKNPEFHKITQMSEPRRKQIIDMNLKRYLKLIPKMYQELRKVQFHHVQQQNLFLHQLSKKSKQFPKISQLLHTLKCVLMGANTLKELASKLYPKNASIHRLVAQLNEIIEKHKRYILNQGIVHNSGNIEQIYNRTLNTMTDPKVQKEFHIMVRKDQVLSRFENLQKNPKPWSEFQSMIQVMFQDFHSMLPTQNEALKKYIQLSLNLLSNLVLREYPNHVSGLDLEFYKLRNLVD